MALYNATDGANWTDNTNWLSNEPLSEWHGVTTRNGRVKELYLISNQLTGEIPTQLGNLAQLWVLDIPDNQLTGKIPVELGNLAQLRVLHLAGNQLTGEIPTQLGQLTQLRVFDLGDNQLTGEIPTWLAELTQLQELFLDRNQLIGEIPTELGNLAQLQFLSLSHNQLTGLIPVELTQLTQLQVFDIRNTGLCVTADSELHTWLETINFQGSVCITGGGAREVLDFAHFANGASNSGARAWTSDLVFVNVGSVPVRPALYFYDTEGQPITAAAVVDITGDLEITEDGALTVLTAVESLGELTISTHGRGDQVSGSVKVLSGGPIGGVLRFYRPGIGVAGVGTSTPMRDALFPARRLAGGINTGVAIHSLEEEPLGVRCRLMKEGAVLEEIEIPLEANGQTSWFIDEVFTAADTSDFVGSVRCAAPGGGLFTGVAVELDAANRIFTTLPLVPVSEMPPQE